MVAAMHGLQLGQQVFGEDGGLLQGKALPSGGTLLGSSSGYLPSYCRVLGDRQSYHSVLGERHSYHSVLGDRHSYRSVL